MVALSKARTSDQFYKRSQEKNSFPAAGFLVGFQPTSWSRIVVAFRSVLSGRCAQLRRGFGFPCQRFSSRLRDEASLFGDHKQHGCQLPTMVLIWNDLSTTSNCFFFLFLTLGRQRGLWSR